MRNFSFPFRAVVFKSDDKKCSLAKCDFEGKSQEQLLTPVQYVTNDVVTVHLHSLLSLLDSLGK
jgi:hypothetical protein